MLHIMPVIAIDWVFNCMHRFDFDPLDVTKTWPENIFPLQPIGRMVSLTYMKRLGEHASFAELHLSLT